MSERGRQQGGHGEHGSAEAREAGRTPGKRTLTEGLRPAAGAFAKATAGEASEVPYRAEMEGAFGRSFAGVSAHLGGPTAEEGLGQLGAKAAAFGDVVAFKDAAPSKGLVAHELAHVVQQDGAPGVQRKPEGVSSEGDPAELRADAAAAAVERGERVGDVGRAPGGMLHRQTNGGGTGATTAVVVDPVQQALDLLDRRRAGEELTADEWNVLAAGAAKLLSQPGTIGGRSRAEVVASCFIDSRVSWDNATDEVRKVFMSLPAARREPLRVQLLKNSKLFGAISSMHVSKDSPTKGTDRKNVDELRLHENGGPGDNTTDWSSVAGKLIDGHEIAQLALIQPVADQGTGAFANKALAGWVKAAGAAKVKQKIHNLACGLSSLFALSLSRGYAAGDPPSVADGVRWLKEWSLDKAPGTGLLDSDGATCSYNPMRVVTALSESRASRIKKPFQVPGSGPDFSKEIEKRLTGVKLGAQEESRLALVQGSGGTHTFFVYKDLDDVWRPMDVYLNLEDQGAEQDGRPGNYSSGISTLYFVVDKK